MKVLLLAIGSHGDVHPFIGLGLALKSRGHDVHVIVNPHFADLVHRNNLSYIPLGKAEDFETLRENPDLWHPSKGLPTVINAVLDGLKPVYEAIVNNYVSGETVVAAGSLGLGARIAQDKLNIPTATVHLAPAVLRSTIQPPKLPGVFMPAWLPRWTKQALFNFGDWAIVDRLFCPRINAFRKEIGLPPVRGILKNWWNSPQRIIGLFPDWFSPPQIDWPVQTRLTGFPLYDEHGLDELPKDLIDFLNDGEPPIVFTPGSAMFHGHDFFEASVQATKQISRRALLLSKHAGHIPTALPKSIKYFNYVPFSQVLAQSAVIVHHGGIGTSAQAMRAGVKQLIVPFSHDQFDNSHRMQKLEIARELRRKKYQIGAVAKMLDEMLSDSEMSRRCAEVAFRFAGIDPITQSCELIEELF